MRRREIVARRRVAARLGLNLAGDNKTNGNEVATLPEEYREQEQDVIFALDIGTRSIVGAVGRAEEGRFHVLDIEKEEHGKRAMLDGQIEDIDQVVKIARQVVQRLEQRLHIRLKRVCVAAAGRSLRSQKADFKLEFEEPRQISDEMVNQLEAGALAAAENVVLQEQDSYFYMVGYTAAQYRLDGYPMSTLQGHRGRRLEVDLVATFLPREVVDSLYTVVGRMGLEVASLTLEPIASLNAAIPMDIRLLNLVLVDIGAGTSDIAVCRDGSVVGYTMATVAGDEITELLMKKLLIDFKTAENLKMAIGGKEPLRYTDILGMQHKCTLPKIVDLIQPAVEQLAKEIAAKILELNGMAPSAVFLAGGGSKLYGLRQVVAEQLKMDEVRVTIAGNHFEKNAFSDEFELNNPEYSTPLGIAISAALGMINDSYMVTLNGLPAKLFRSGTLTVRDILLMNGCRYGDMMGRTGANLSFMLNGERRFVRGGQCKPANILLNGKEAEPSTVVHAGDTIEFEAAKPGKNATRTLAEVLGADYQGAVLVNGELAELSYQIKSGDIILADVFADLAEAEPFMPSDDVDNADNANNKIEETEKNMAAAVSDNTPDVPLGRPLTVNLNGERVVLVAKPKGEPHYLMDALQHSDLDFQNLDKPVELFVNGLPGQFSQKLLEGDEVVIRCREKTTK